jgi:hypothetical protein
LYGLPIAVLTGLCRFADEMGRLRCSGTRLLQEREDRVRRHHPVTGVRNHAHLRNKDGPEHLHGVFAILPWDLAGSAVRAQDHRDEVEQRRDLRAVVAEPGPTRVDRGEILRAIVVGDYRHRAEQRIDAAGTLVAFPVDRMLKPRTQSCARARRAVDRRSEPLQIAVGEFSQLQGEVDQGVQVQPFAKPTARSRCGARPSIDYRTFRADPGG